MEEALTDGTEDGAPGALSDVTPVSHLPQYLHTYRCDNPPASPWPTGHSTLRGSAHLLSSGNENSTGFCLHSWNPSFCSEALNAKFLTLLQWKRMMGSKSVVLQYFSNFQNLKSLQMQTRNLQHQWKTNNLVSSFKSNPYITLPQFNVSRH